MVVPPLLNNSVWGVKTLTSGVDDCYVKPDIPKQIFSITRVTHTHTTHNSNDDKFNNLERLTADELVDATRLLKCQKRQIEVIRRLHRSCGYRSIKLLINLS
jgi:hypothetical protein